MISFIVNLDLFRIRSLTSANKIFNYDNEVTAHRKHIIADRIRYIGKESNNLDESLVIGINEDSYLEYDNPREFYDWILSLKPENVR